LKEHEENINTRPSHQKVRYLLKKSKLIALIFSIVCLAWAYLFYSSMTEDNTPKSFKKISSINHRVNGIDAQEWAKYVRIGAPGARKDIKNNLIMKDTHQELYKTQKEEVLMNLNSSKYDKRSSTDSFPKNKVAEFIIAAVVLFSALKIAIYLNHFSKYQKALEMQANAQKFTWINSQAQTPITQLPPSTPKIAQKEEKSTSYMPLIQEEPCLAVPEESFCDPEDTKIYSCTNPASYPTIAAASSMARPE